MASRMQPAKYETTSVRIAAGEYRFSVAASRVVFEGFRCVYTEADEEKEENNVLLKGLDQESRLTKDSFETKQHFTQPPAHYTEAALVKTLEELGIGRPSTYAPTITTIISRRYVAKENKNLYMTEMGESGQQHYEAVLPQHRRRQLYGQYGRPAGRRGGRQGPLEDDH